MQTLNQYLVGKKKLLGYLILTAFSVIIEVYKTTGLHLNTGTINLRRLISPLLVCYALFMACNLYGQSTITTITTSSAAATPSTDSPVTAPDDTGNSIADDAGEIFTVNYGQGNNISVTEYTVDGIATPFDNFIAPDTLVLNRRVSNDRLVNIWYVLEDAGPEIIDNAGTPGDPDVVNMDADEVSDADAIYLSNTLNNGYDNILVNDDDLAGGSIQVETERVDVIWYQGIQTSTPGNAVFPIIERGGNDNVAIAAITSLNGDGTPATYGTLIGIPETFWPGTGVVFDDYLILRRETAGTDPLPLLNIGPLAGQGSQTVQGVAVTFTELGISASQNIFGYSIFPADVCDGFVTDTGDVLTTGAQTIAAGVTLSDITTFPSNTTSNDSGLDLVAGVSAAVANDDNLIETKGPGGFKTALATWLKANDGAFVTSGGAASTEGSNVGFWEDQSVGNHDYTTLVTAPTFRSTTSSINFNPTVDFLDGSETGLQTPDDEDYNVKSVNDGYTRKGINIAFRTTSTPANLDVKQQLFEEGGGTNGLGIYIRNSTLHMSVWNRGSQAQGDWNDSGSAAETVSVSLSTNTEYIVTLEFEGDAASAGGGSIVGYLNGQQFGSLTAPFGQNIGLLYNHGDDIGLGQHDGASLYDDNATEGDSFYGEISEFIYCNEPSSFPLQQRNRIESYLAIKYGITLDQSTPIDYYNSNGDIIFDATNNASIGGYLEYNNDIAGIGRDDASELDQPQSRSENTGSIVTIDRGSTIGTDDAWLIWGNDGDDNGVVEETAALTMPLTIASRTDRVWRVAERNEVQTTSVSFDLTGLGFSTEVTDFNLLIASNSSGADFSNATVVPAASYDGGTNTVTFTGIDLDDGQYFTLGLSNFFCTPGNYADGAVMWLRADEGVTTATEGQTVTDWQDQTEGDNDGSNITAPIYRETTQLINDNPTVDFTTGSTGIVIGNSGPTNVDQSLSKKFSIVFRTDDDITTQQVIYEQGGATRGLNLYIQSGVLHLSAWNQASDGTGSPWNTAGSIATVNTSAIAINTTYLVTFDYAGNDAITGSVTGYLNGESFGTPLSNIGRLYGHTDPIGLGDENSASRYGDGSTSGAASFDGYIPEIVYYDSPSSYLTADRNRVESNMAIKYGITLDQTSATNYTKADGNTIWDATTNATYNNDIAGIGRDDRACLNQKQSQSENANSIVKMGLGGIAATNAANANTFDDDGDFLVWGSDGDFADNANVNTVDVPGTVTERMERIWRVDDTGSVGATEISFDLTSLGYGTNVSDFQLIVSNSATMASGSTFPAASYDVGSNTVTFTGIDLTDGQFFTLGTARTSCGPGGIIDDLAVWLRADLGTSTTTDGVEVTSWTDQGLSNNGTATGGTAPTYDEVSMNFNPALDFNGSDEFMEDAAGMYSTAYYFVMSPDNTITTASTLEVPVGFDVGSAAGVTSNIGGFGLGGVTGGTTDIVAHIVGFGGTSYIRGETGPRTLSSGEPILFSVRDDAVSATETTISQNGLRVDDQDVEGSTIISFTDEEFELGRFEDPNALAASFFYNGQISEVISYSVRPTDAENDRIESYLAIKYGITLDNSGGGTDGDYFSGDGTTVWNADFNDGINGAGAYHNDVAGIGRSDAGCFIQKQSSSVNTDDILTVGLGSIAASNAANINSFSDDDDYFVWGNDNGSTASASAETTDVPSTVSERMTRIWRAEDNGLVGATELQFDLTSTGFQTSDATSYSLLVSNSEDMASATIITGGTFNGSVLSFSGIDITDGQFFTIGTAFTTCGPGGVNGAVAVWLRADLEAYSDTPGSTLATDGDDVLEWGDQSSPAVDGLEDDLGGGGPIEPTFETNEFNFNPVLRFTDPNSTNSSYIQTSDVSVTGDFTHISVFKTGQAQGSAGDYVNSPALVSMRSTEGSNDHAMGMENGTIYLHADSDAGFEAETSTTFNDNDVHIALGTRVSGSGALEIFVDGNSEVTGTGATGALSNADNSVGVGNHAIDDVQAQFAGDIAETIVLNEAVDSEERNRIESYLAVKYGLTLNSSDDLGTGSVDERDYRAADGGTIWDFDRVGNSTYYNDIFGIGRDDLSCFEQTQSKSESSDALVTFNNGGSFGTNDSFILSGNDNAVIEQTGNGERPPGISSRLNREWRVQETGTVGSIELTYDLSTITGPLGVGTNNLSQLRLMVDDDGDFTSGVTLISPTSINGTDNTATFTVDFEDAQYYTLGSIEKAALPVTLISFNAKNVDNERVVLDWATATELNNSFFAIQRSENGIDFEDIANVDGAGNSSSVRFYSFTDNNPLNGFSFYRLKQTDFSGEFEYSEIKSVYLEKSSLADFSLYPNPIVRGNTVRIRHTLEEDQDLAFAFIDLKGQILYRDQRFVRASQAFIELPTDNLRRGLNLLKIVDKDQRTITLKLVVR